MAGPLPGYELEFRIEPLSHADFPHRHPYYEIAFITTSPPMLCFAIPGQVRFWPRAAGLEGKVIQFPAEFLEAYPRDREVLQALGSARSLTLSKKDGLAFAAVTREMEEEYGLRGPGSTAILQACLHVLLLRAARLSSARAVPAGGAASIARKFVTLLGLPGAACSGLKLFRRRGRR
jgi:AraC family transcriptional regulator, transcriptional activator of pobA